MSFDLDMRAISAVLEDDDEALQSFCHHFQQDDGRKRRRGGWGKLVFHLGDPASTQYLQRSKGKYWLSPIWKDLENDETYV